MVTNRAPTRTLKPIKDHDELESIAAAVSSFDLPSSEAWPDLDELSTHTAFDDLEANIDGIFRRSDGKIEIAGTAYVTLNYGGKKDTTSMTEGYPAKIVGIFDDNRKFVIETASVDTSSFFE